MWRIIYPPTMDVQYILSHLKLSEGVASYIAIILEHEIVSKYDRQKKTANSKLSRQ